MMSLVAKIGSLEIETNEGHIYHSHNLPATYDYVPWNIIGRLIRDFDLGDCKLIDVGANVGDTAAHFRRHSNATAICIEPSDFFFPILERNAVTLGDVHLIKKLFSPPDLVGRVSYHSSDRTGGSQLSSGEDRWSGDYITFKEILAQFGKSYILKSDTDGFDAEIVRSALPHIANGSVYLPIVFFEGPGEEQMRTADYSLYVEVCEELQRIGYSILLLTNAGMPYLYAGTSPDVIRSAFSVLHMSYTRSMSLCHYYDILAVSSKLASDFFKATRPWPEEIFDTR